VAREVRYRGTNLRVDEPKRPSLHDAIVALQENLSLLDREKNKIAHNLNTALVIVCHALGNISAQVAQAQDMMRPILKEMGDDYADRRDYLDKNR